jgi:hypothetical protein
MNRKITPISGGSYDRHGFKAYFLHETLTYVVAYAGYLRHCSRFIAVSGANRIGSWP